MNSTKEEEQHMPTSTPICFIVKRSEVWRWAKLKSTGILPPWKAQITGHVQFTTLEELRCRLGVDGIHHPTHGEKVAAHGGGGWAHVNQWSTQLVYGEDLPTAQQIAETLIAERVG